MDWYRREITVSRHPKTHELRRILHDRRAEIYLDRIWAWLAQMEVESGEYPDEETIENEAGWKGKSGTLCIALRKAGFLDNLTVHGWTERNGANIAKAKQDRERRAKERRMAQRVPRQSRDYRGTIVGQSRDNVT